MICNAFVVVCFFLQVIAMVICPTTVLQLTQDTPANQAQGQHLTLANQHQVDQATITHNAPATIPMV